MNRFTELLSLIEGGPSMRMLELSGSRREIITEALRIAAASILAPIPHASTNEKLIVGKLVTDLLAAGYAITVNDGEEDVVVCSTDPAAIFPALSSTDEDFLYVANKDGANSRFIRLVWGNDVDVISDYHVSLESYLTGANALANELDN